MSDLFYDGSSWFALSAAREAQRWKQLNQRGDSHTAIGFEEWKQIAITAEPSGKLVAREDLMAERQRLLDEIADFVPVSH